jgi:hypothetical protein
MKETTRPILEELLKNSCEAVIDLGKKKIILKSLSGEVKGNNTGSELFPVFQIIPIFAPSFMSPDEGVNIFEDWCENIVFPTIPALYKDITKAIQEASTKLKEREILLSVYGKNGKELKNTFRHYKNGHLYVHLLEEDIKNESKIIITGIDRFNTEGDYKSEFVLIGKRVR